MGVTPDLTLTGAVEGLLLRGSPVNVDFLGLAVPGVYTARDTRPANQRNGPYLVAPVDCWPEDFNGSSEMIRSCKSEETTLDLTHPLGLATALHYLRERGHDLAWAARWPDVVAWSVLAVARGGEPPRCVLDEWRTERLVCGRNTPGADEHGNVECATRSYKAAPRRFGSWRRASVTPDGWYLETTERIPDGGSATISYVKGPETGDAGRAVADAAALAAGYALLNDDSTLTLPSLPEVPNV